MSESGEERPDNPRGTKRRTILKALGTTSVAAIPGPVSADDTDDRNTPGLKRESSGKGLVKKYENRANVNKAISDQEGFITEFFTESGIDKPIDELMVDDVTPPTETDHEGILVRTERTTDGKTVKLNIVRNTRVGPINIALYPESDIEPYATVTVEEHSEIGIYRREHEEVDGSATLRVSSDTFDESVRTQSHHIPSWACSTCPTDTTCCQCKRECINECCMDRCTPVYDYYCDCCRWSRPSCWGDCY